MDESKIFLTIQEVFREQFLDPDMVVLPTTQPSDCDAWDSLAHIGIMLSIAGQFDVDFTAEDITEIDCVEDIVDLVSTKLKN